MSLNSDKERAQGGGNSPPRLQTQPGGYVAWRPRMSVWLTQRGAKDVHVKPTLGTEQVWKDVSARVSLCQDEAFARALADTGVGSSSSTQATPVLSPEAKDTRRELTTAVERSAKVYGWIYSALPEELAVQVAHIPTGWAFGLWQWLERKFQSTEADGVWELMAEWTALSQTSDESFDAYVARVNRLSALLEHAKEKPSPQAYAFAMLGKLQPRYKQVVLALKASDLLKEPKSIDWSRVVENVNDFERGERRQALASDDAEVAAATVASQRGSKQRGWSKVVGTKPSAS